ncbi:response regulator transcription factor [Caminibacter sp.]
MRILLIEDDFDLHETIKDYLQMQGFEVESAFDGEEGLSRAYEENFDLMIVDVKMPKMDGFSMVKEIRKHKNTPVIFLTSLNSEKEIEEGFLSGGDDYITKPFSLKELKLRIDAITRRVYGGEIVKIGDVEFDVKGEVLRKDGKEIRLKPKEIKLLKLFLKNRGKILSKEKIFNELYDMEEPNERSLRVFINDLRNVIGKEKIETIKNRGYRFVG